MGKILARRIATLLLSFAMICSCLFVFSACKDDKETPAVVTISSISVALAEESHYTLANGAIDVNYNGTKFEFSASDFVVTATKSDNTTVVISQKTDTADGYTLTSTVPTEEVTPVGEYKLTFAYTGVSSVEIKVNVNKGNVNVSGVSLRSLTYNGTEQTLQVADILNLPANVTAEFVSGHSGTNAQNYDAVVRFTYNGADAESYNTIPDKTITWTMQKANYNVSNISWVRGAITTYTGLPQTVEISVDGELPEGMTIKGYLNNSYTNAGRYTAKVQFNYETLNYNKPAVADFEWVIDKAPLTVTAKPKTITFGDEPANDGVTYSGFVNSETESVLGGALSYEYGAYYVGNDVGEYDITVSGLTADNYAITFVKGTLTVTQASYNYADISWVDVGPYTYSSFIQKPTVSGVPEYVEYSITTTKGGSDAESIGAGSYTATFSVSSFKNYTFEGTVPTKDYVIQQAALSITANNNTITYGSEPSHAGTLIEGFKGSDNSDILKGEFVYAYGGYEAGDDVGDYDITVSGVTADNYAITFKKGILTVEAITLQYSSVSFVYEDTYNYDGQTKALTVSGVPTYVGYSITYTKGGSVAIPKNAGTYVATFTITESNNFVYMGQIPTQEFVINKVALTVTAKPKTITFGDEPANDGVTYSGFVNGETVAVLGGTLAFDYEGYASGSNAGSYRITPSGYTSNNYEISYVAGLLTVQAITHNYNEISFNYTGKEKFVYNGTAVEFIASGVPDYVTYDVVYKLNDTTVVDEAVDAGTYSVTFVPQTSVNYIFEGEVLKVEFTIDKATIDADELYFTIDSEKVTTVDSVGDGEYSPSYLITYKEIMYYDGAEHEVNFVNNTGIEGVAISFEYSQEQRFVKNISSHHFSALVSVSESALKNYEALEYTNYMLVLSIKDYFKAVKVTYIDRIDTEVEHVQSGEIEISRDALTTQSFDGVIIDIEFVLAEEGLEEVYFVNLYTDRSYTTSVLSDLSNLNNYDNVLYVGANFSGGSVFDEMAIKFVMEFKADTNEYKYTLENEINYATNESTIKSINIETESVLFYVDYASSLFTTSVELGYVQIQEYPDSDGDGQPEYVETITFTSEAYPLQAGVNSLLIRYNYTYNEVTYSYTRSVNIVYSVSSAGNFTITYKSENGNVTGADNAVEISNVTIQDIVGDDMMTADPQKAIEDICENIDVTAKTAGGYEEEVGANGESLREVKIEGGNAYLCVPVKEKPDDGTIVFLGLNNYAYTADGDEPIGGGTEGGEDLTTPTTSLFMYILLNFGFDIDFNTNANVYADGSSVIDAGEFGYIQMKTGQFLNVTAENESAMLIVMRIGDSLDNMGDDWVPTEYQMFYGEITQHYFDQTGYYSLTIMPTASIFGVEYEPKPYIIEVTSSSGEGGETPVNPEIIYNVQAKDYLGHGVNNEGVITNETQMCDIVAEDGVITLNNWDNTKYLEIATNGNDYFVVNFGGNTIIEKWASNFVMNFEEAGNYIVVIERSVQGKPVTKTIIINVYGFEENFLNITANDSNISVDLTQTYDLVSDDAVIFTNMIPDNQGNEDENEYVEAYIGAVAGLGSTYELAFTSVYSNLIYEVDTDTTIAYQNGKATLNVKNDGTFNYVEFEIKNPNTPNGAISPETVVRVYFCDKADRLKYHTLTIGSSTYQVALDLTRAGDYGTLYHNYESGGAYAIVKESDTNTNITADATFTAYSGYSRPAGSYEYLMFTADAYNALMQQIGNGTISTRAGFDAFIASAKAEGGVFEPTNSTSISVPLNFESGLAELYIASVNLTQQVLDYAFEMIEYLIQPIEFRIDGIYKEPDNGGSGDNGQGGQPGQGGGSVAVPSYDYRTQLPEGIEIAIVVNGETYSISNGDILFEEAIPEYYVRLRHSYADLVNQSTNKVTITSFTSNIPDFVIYDMQGNQVDSTAAFEIAWSVHNQFGNAVRFRAEVQNIGTAMFVLAFEDSTPPGYVPFAAVDNGFEFSISFNDANSNLKTYSTETNNFYYQPQGMGYQFFTRIDLTREEVRSIIKEGEPGTGWIDLIALTIDISSFVPDATFVGYINGWTQDTYQELKAAALINYEYIGEAIVIEALYNFDDNEVRIEVYLIPKDSISQTYQDSGNSGLGGSGGSGSEEGGADCIIDMYYNDFAGSLSCFSDFSGEFVLDNDRSDFATVVVFVATLDASVLNGASTFTLNEIEYNTELLGYIDVSDGNNTSSSVTVSTETGPDGNVYTISENVTLSVIDNSVALQVIGYDDAEKQIVNMTYLFVINFVTAAA